MTTIQELCDKIFKFNGIGKEFYKSRFSEVEIRKMIIESVKIGYAQALIDSTKIE